MIMEKSQKKVALVHDFLVSYGGAERVFQTLCAMYPEAPIYTLLADGEIVAKHFPGREIRTSWLGKLPQFVQKRYRLFLPFFPAAVESLDLREFDLVLSSSGAWSKGIITRLNTTHVAYLHSPMRYAWDSHESYLQELGASGRKSILTRMLMSYLRIWDRQAADRPDILVANSLFTADRIRKYYRREAAIVYPPVSLRQQVAVEKIAGSDTEKESQSSVPKKYFLVVSRLTTSKGIDRVIEAFNKLSLPLLIVGAGAEKKHLEDRAGEHIRFVGFVEDQELATLYQNARAVLFPSEEDFGMVAAEALSFGTPVIGLDYGGLREIITPGVTGELFHTAAPEIIAEGVRRFLEHEGQYDATVMQTSVQKFNEENFREGMRAAMKEEICD